MRYVAVIMKHHATTLGRQNLFRSFVSFFIIHFRRSHLLYIYPRHTTHSRHNRAISRVDIELPIFLTQILLCVKTRAQNEQPPALKAVFSQALRRAPYPGLA